MPKYDPKTTNINPAINRELHRISEEFNNPQVEHLEFDTQNAAPTKPKQGHEYYADGTNWDPGSGEGKYYYDGSSWIFMGAQPRSDASILSSLAGDIGLTEIAIGRWGGEVIILKDSKTSGTGGGAFTSGAWRTRTINTEEADSGSHCSLSSNQFTLDAGTYEIEAFASASQCRNHQARLQNITDASTTLEGTTEYADDAVGGTAVVCQNKSYIVGTFTIASSKAFEIQHQCSFTGTYGTAASFTNEIYLTVKLKKVI